MSRTKSVSLTVNGRHVMLELPPSMSLLEMLRERLGLTGAKEGCANGECGACTVILNGQPVRSCLVLAVEADGGEVTTVEGLAKGATLDPVQEAFIAADAVQCGFCAPGYIVAVRALLDRRPNPTREEVQEALGGHLCRCTGYEAIFEAIERLAGELVSSSENRAARENEMA